MFDDLKKLVWMSVRPSICPSVHLSVRPSIRPSVRPSVQSHFFRPIGLNLGRSSTHQLSICSVMRVLSGCGVKVVQDGVAVLPVYHWSSRTCLNIIPFQSDWYQADATCKEKGGELMVIQNKVQTSACGLIGYKNQPVAYWQTSKAVAGHTAPREFSNIFF